jgi:hypothetical protein
LLVHNCGHRDPFALLLLVVMVVQCTAIGGDGGAMY